MASSKLTLKLLIDKNTQRLLFAEAGKDFVDFLFSLLALPVGAVMKLLESGYAEGGLAKLYKSVSTLSHDYILPGKNINVLLEPKVSIPFSFPEIPLSFPSSNAAKFYKCEICNTCRSDYSVNCCGQLMKLSTPNGGFVKGLVTYMVTDDLIVSPMSTMSNITLLNKFNIKDLGAIEEKVVDILQVQALELLKHSFTSKTVLTDVFLREGAVINDSGKRFKTTHESYVDTKGRGSVQGSTMYTKSTPTFTSVFSKDYFENTYNLNKFGGKVDSKEGGPVQGSTMYTTYTGMNVSPMSTPTSTSSNINSINKPNINNLVAKGGGYVHRSTLYTTYTGMNVSTMSTPSSTSTFSNKPNINNFGAKVGGSVQGSTPYTTYTGMNVSSMSTPSSTSTFSNKANTNNFDAKGGGSVHGSTPYTTYTGMNVSSMSTPSSSTTFSNKASINNFGAKGEGSVQGSTPYTTYTGVNISTPTSTSSNIPLTNKSNTNHLVAQQEKVVNIGKNEGSELLKHSFSSKTVPGKVVVIDDKVKKEKNVEVVNIDDKVKKEKHVEVVVIDDDKVKKEKDIEVVVKKEKNVYVEVKKEKNVDMVVTDYKVKIEKNCW